MRHTHTDRTRPARLLASATLVLGILFVVTGVSAWAVTSNQLASEQITVSEDAPMLAGSTVAGPLSAFAQAEAIRGHALDAASGKSYAELSQDDPARETVTTATLLRASLFTSVLSFGVCALAIGVGVVTAVVGAALLVAARATRADRG